MKIRASLLLVTAIFLSGSFLISCDAKTMNGKKEAHVEHKTFFEKVLEAENHDIGFKYDYGKAAVNSYQKFLQAACNGQTKESEQHWLDFQTYSQGFRETRTPYVANAFYGGFGYWLYHRIAYPANKKNWGSCKKVVASVMIPVWLFGSALLADPSLDKKKDDLRAQQEKTIKELQEENVTILAKNEELQKEREEDEHKFTRAFQACLTMPEQERRTWVTPAKTTIENVKAVTTDPSVIAAVMQKITDEENRQRALAYVAVSNTESKQLLPVANPENVISRTIETRVWWKKYLGWYWLKDYCSKK